MKKISTHTLALLALLFSLFATVANAATTATNNDSDPTGSTGTMEITSMAIDCDFAKAGEPRQLYVRVANRGVEERNCPAIYYKIGGGATKRLDGQTAIKGGGDLLVTIADTVATDAPVGLVAAKAWLDGDTSVDDGSRDSVLLYIYENSYPRNILLEHFTTLGCINCPMAKKSLAILLSGATDVIHVAHHVGFGTDEFTIGASEDLSLAFNIDTAPVAMFDRTMTPLSTEANPTVNFVGNTPSSAAEYLKPVLAYIRQQPAFVSVGIDCDYDEQTRTLTVNTTGERCAEYADMYGDGGNLTVYIVEDKVKATAPQKGEESVYTHNHIIRAALTPSDGNAIEWRGDKFSQTFTTTLDDSWKPGDIKVVAFVNQPLSNDANDYGDMRVLNAKELALSTTLAIATAKADEDTGTTEVYNLQGQSIASGTAQRKGVYVERTRTQRGTVAMKRIVK